MHHIKPFRFPILIFIGFIFVAHVVALSLVPEHYHWYTNTISDLAAQGYDFRWIMRSGLSIFGLMTMYMAGYEMSQKNGVSASLFFIFFYGLFIAITGYFRIKPFIPGLPYNVIEDYLHSLFATLTGIAISGGIILDIFPFTKQRKKKILQSITFGTAIVICSIMFGIADSQGSLYTGLIQRFLWIIGLTWLFNFSSKTSA